MGQQGQEESNHVRAKINQAYRQDEGSVLTELCEYGKVSERDLTQIQGCALQLVQEVRNQRKQSTGIDSFLTEYSLSTDEGIALMCLAEALLRVPDKATIDQLIRDKLGPRNWKSHLGQSDSFFINATTWALMLTGKVLTPAKAESVLSKALFKLINRSGEPLIRTAVDRAMRIMSKQFVMGRTIGEALSRAKKKEAKGYRYSYDMLGEAALTMVDAERYFSAYYDAIQTIGKSLSPTGNLYSRPGISVKLSALHPRYQESQAHRVREELPPKVLALAQAAKKVGIALTIDAEESERLEISLDVIEKVFSDPSLEGWDGFGMAVQSYQKRAFYLLDWIAALARKNQKKMMVRLIKGAYWDSEIKKTQMAGLSDYPVFTRKTFTDVSFQACAKKILQMTDAIYPQFATHNAYSVAMILNLVGDYRDFEFQALHGMGKELYEQIVPLSHRGIPCRIYAPVGTHEDLLPYLVRRLLENGANSSFVNRIIDEKAPLSSLIEDPIAKTQLLLTKLSKNLPAPSDIFLPQRKNSRGFDLSDREQIAYLENYYQNSANARSRCCAKPIIKTTLAQKPAFKGEIERGVFSPQNPQQAIGTVTDTTAEQLEIALSIAQKSFNAWTQVSVEERIAAINRFAQALEAQRLELYRLLCLEAGKTATDAISEVREAIDFCYYYSSLAQNLFSKPQQLQGYTGELNELILHPRGVVLCISPWNFPLAIFTGQIVAALLCGNAVIAKPAEQTPLIAYFAVQLMHAAGIPGEILHLLPGKGETVGAKLVADQRIKAVIFTGSTQTAALINQTLAHRGGEIIPLIAETGGQNAMIVDSSALLEQVVGDVLVSAFGSAGQRCSALRVLYIQEEVYPRFIHLLKGAMAELKIGEPQHLATDVGPVIDEEAQRNLREHVEKMRQRYEIIFQCPLSERENHGYFMPPTAIAIPKISVLEREVFGPILHIIKYRSSEMDEVIRDINSTGYGLTLGIHSRINSTVEYIRQRVKVGNCYVNRNMIGAVVGLQPFGGEGLSGTGPKAGGPYYLLRLCVEKTFTVDTTAAGGNASLMSLPEGF